ncbi:hypothetical protein VTO42DRAFT_3505 [Malbranchea cinnamomea]
MEADERPRKLQKIEDGSAVAPKEEGLPELQSTDERANEQSEEQQQKNEGTATPDQNGANGSTEARTEDQKYPSGLSKNQLKKLKKKERWEAGREWRKAKRKEKERAKRERERAARAELARSQAGDQENGQDAAKPCRRTLTKTGRGRSSLVPVTFVLDCDFDDLMLDKERVSLASQITRCYSDNSRAPYRAHLVVASFNKKLKERFDTVLRKQYDKWRGVTLTGDDFVTAAQAAQDRMQGPDGGKLLGAFSDQTQAKPEDGEVIYLTSDSPHTLTELKPYHTYIIGGLVDKNRHKGICYKRAMERGVKTARLPIGDYMQMASRFVLATNHVVEIMLKWMELKDWGQAFSLVMPKRKGGVLKNKEEKDHTGDNEPAEADHSDQDQEDKAKSNESFC